MLASRAHGGWAARAVLKGYIDFEDKGERLVALGEARSFNWVMAPLRVKSDRSH